MDYSITHNAPTQQTQHMQRAQAAQYARDTQHDTLERARDAVGALTRRLDYLLTCDPAPSPALVHSLLRSTRREAHTVASALDDLMGAAHMPPMTSRATTSARDERPSIASDGPAIQRQLWLTLAGDLRAMAALLDTLARESEGAR